MRRGGVVVLLSKRCGMLLCGGTDAVQMLPLCSRFEVVLNQKQDHDKLLCSLKHSGHRCPPSWRVSGK